MSKNEIEILRFGKKLVANSFENKQQITMKEKKKSCDSPVRILMERKQSQEIILKTQQ